VTNQAQTRRRFAKQQAKARERLAELEQLQRLTVGRVLKIIELSAACMHRGLHLDDEPDFFSFFLFSFFLFSFFFFFTPILFLVVFAPDDLPGPPLSGVGLLATGAAFLATGAAFLATGAAFLATGAAFLATGAAFTSCDIFHPLRFGRLPDSKPIVLG